MKILFYLLVGVLFIGAAAICGGAILGIFYLITTYLPVWMGWTIGGLITAAALGFAIVQTGDGW